MTYAPPVWTPHRIGSLQELWPSGLSCSEIAKAMGLNKNQVIGKAHRLGLVKKKSPIRPIAFDDRRFIRMWDGGVNISHMQFTFGCSRDAILRHVHKLGLQQRQLWSYPKMPKSKLHRILKPDVVPAREVPAESECLWKDCKHIALPNHPYCYGDTHSRQ